MSRGEHILSDAAARRGRLLLATLWLLAAPGCAPTPEGSPGARASAIVGGTPVKAGYDAVAAVLVDGELHCSAVLVAAGAALTAAHCIPGGAQPLTLAFGADAQAATRTVAVREAIAHPLWVGAGNPPPSVGQANDLALLLLGEEVAGVTPASLLTPADAEAAFGAAETVTLVGFGVAAAGGVGGQKAEAEASLVQVGDFELRVSRPGQPQACDGDSGGPALLEVDGALRAVGLVSRTVEAASFCDMGAIYTRIDPYLGFLQDLIRLPCGSGPIPPCGGDGPSAEDAAPPTARPDSGTGAAVGSAGRSSGSGAVRPSSDSGCAIGAAAALPSLAPLALLGLLAISRRRG